MLGELIGAGASLLGGLMQSKQADKQAQQQREFAQSGIQWKVKDAEKAGIHPLYALGAQTTSYQPTQVGDLGIAQAGQNIGRAIDATRSTPASALALQASKAQIEGLNLDNELKKTQLASAVALANQTGPHPSLPGLFTQSAIPGQGDTPQTDPSHHRHMPPQYTPNMRGWGADIQPNPNWSDAQTWEDRYGETISDWIIGPSIAFSDFRHNTRSRDPNHYEKIRYGMSHQKYRR